MGEDHTRVGAAKVTAGGDGLVRRAWAFLRRALGIPLAAAAAVATISRLPYLKDMVGYDATLYLPVAQGWLEGLDPYRDLFAEKGPLVYLFLTGVEAVVPESVLGMRLAFLALIVVSAGLLAALVERHANRPLAWATAVLYALACSSPLWDLAEINTEQVGLPAMVTAVDLADRFDLSRKWWQAAGAGAAVAASFWAKPSIAFVGLLVFVLLVMRPEGRIRGIVAAVAGAIAASVMTLAPYAASGALGALEWSQTSYNRGYVNGGFDDLTSRPFDDQLAWIFNAPGSAFFVAALALGAVAWTLGRHQRLVAIGTTWFLLEYAGAKFGVRDFAHYYVPALAPCAILICAGADALAAHLTGIEHRARTALALAAWLPIATYLVLNIAIVRLGAGADSRTTIAEDVADVVEQVTPRDGRMYLVTSGEGYQVYWLASRSPATRFFWARGMGAAPYSYDESYVTEARRDLALHPPDTVVIWPGNTAPPDDEVQPAIKRAGLQEVANIEGVTILARNLPPGFDPEDSTAP